MSSAPDAKDSALLARMGVWIDQDLCTGDGLCVDHVPQVFTILEDGIAYCREVAANGAKVFNDPGGPAELAIVPQSLEDEVIQAASVCPGECIFLEIPEPKPEIEEAAA